MSSKYFLICITFISTSCWADLSPPDFCASGSESMSYSSCYSTCSAVAANSSAHLSNGQSGICIGQSAYRKFQVYKIAIGSESVGDTPLCTIWSGDYTITTHNQEKQTSLAAGDIDLSGCPAGEYDFIVLTSSRFEEFKLDTVYPDGSGRVLRSTDTYANPNRANDSTYSTSSNFLETSSSHSDTTKGYVRPASGYSNMYLKLGDAPISTDLSGVDAELMYYDWAKAFAFYGTYNTFRTGWYCDGSDDVCDRVNPDDATKTDLFVNKDSGIVDGLPFTLTGKETVLNFEINYHSANRGSNEELGTEVAFVNDGGTIKAIGVKPGESGAYGVISGIE